MQLIATLEVLTFYVIAFGVRSLVQWMKTGKTGFAGVRQGAPPLEWLGAALLMLVVVLGPIAPWIGSAHFEWGRGFGVALAGLGIVFTLVAQLQMGTSWRIGVDPSERTALVTGGVFALVRNPIYSAMLLTSVGLALAVPTTLALALPPVLLLALEIQVRVVEEPYLREVHGEPYRAWAARTGRFVPGVGRLTS
ncbi:MAG: isoprenylcysteine carboxylmethyltransferase family protein [Polyangiaceae bacterium]|nr:isoprenylcysteine carboxylmethyltransferase family protein [Polyangiaceae bacterium]